MSQTLPESQHHLFPSVALLALRIFFFCFLVETAYALLLLLLIGTPFGEQYALGSLTLLWAVHTLKFIFEISVLLRIVAGALTTRYYLGANKLIIYSGVFDQYEQVYDLTQLKNILVMQDWLGRHLKYGDLRLTLTSSGFKEEVMLTGLNDPRKYERLLREQYLGS